MSHLGRIGKWIVSLPDKSPVWALVAPGTDARSVLDPTMAQQLVLVFLQLLNLVGSLAYIGHELPPMGWYAYIVFPAATT